MRLTTHKIERKPNDRTAVKAEWRDRFRQPAHVKVVIDRAGLEHGDELVEGDTKDVQGAIFGIAEIAWNMGWRPDGLINTLMGVITSHKIRPK